LASLQRGEKVWIFDGLQGSIKTTAYYQFESGTLTAGVLDIKNPNPPAPGLKNPKPDLATVRTFKTFMDQSMSLARELKAETLRLEGSTVVNKGKKGVEGLLDRQGFKPKENDPSSYYRETSVK
jgi:hypothetical protein